MNGNYLRYASALDLAASIREHALSPVEAVAGLLERIERLNGTLNAFSAVRAEAAIAEARALERSIRDGQPAGPLAGVPVAIKEQINVTGQRIAFGSRMLADTVAMEDAPVVARLRAAGAIVVGLTTMPEFGWQGHSWSPLYGTTRNPWDLERTTGGSSAGNGAAVAAGLVPLAIGTDGAGSVRIPASFCGIVGLKPTYGRVPMYPVSLSELVTHYGPMTRTVRDAAIALDVIAGPDPRDPFCLPAANESFLAACDGDLAGLRIGWSPDLGYATVDPEIARVTAAAARRFIDLGASVEEARPGFANPIWAADQFLWAGMANRVADKLSAWREQMDPGFVQAVELMSGRTLFDAARARAERFELAAQMAAFFSRYDLLLTPMMAKPPFGLTRKEAEYGPTIGWSPFSYPFNLTGEPAISVPCGWGSDGLPIGLQIVGPRFAEGRVLRTAAAFEALQPWHDRHPPIDSSASR